MSIISPYGDDYVLVPDPDVTKRNPTAFCIVKRADSSGVQFHITAYLYNEEAFFTVRSIDMFGDKTYTLLETKTSLDTNIPTKFRYIANIQFKNNKIYVLDSTLNTLSVYDASDLIDNNFEDPALNTLKYIKSIGGKGTVGDPYGFNSPSVVFFNDDNASLLVYDKGNGAVKLYDKNLNWVDTFRKAFDFKGVSSFDYILDENCYMTVNDSGDLLKFDKEFVVIKKVLGFLPMVEGEFVLQIIASDNIPNLVYIITNKRILKKYGTNDSAIIGFVNSRLSIYDFTLFGASSPILFVASSRNGVFPEDILSIISEVSIEGDVQPITTFFRISDGARYLFLDANAVNMEATKFDKSDFHQALAYGSLESLRYETQLLAQILSSRIVFSGNMYASIVVDTEIIPDTDLSALITDLGVTPIGMNEHPTPNTVNRYLEKILEIQTTIARILNIKNKNPVPDYVPAPPEPLPPPEIIPIP